MKNHKISEKQYADRLFLIFFLLTPLIAAALFCLRDGKTILDLYLPLGGWSDEITYYKQIEGILSHGMPKGYFGYNQSRAMIGPLGVWGIVPLIPYVIWGFFFGWNYLSPIYANLFWCTLSLLCVCLILRPRKRWMAMLSLFWIANPFLNRYIVSGVVEASVTAQLLIVTACGIRLLPGIWPANKNSCSPPPPKKYMLSHFMHCPDLFYDAGKTVLCGIISDPALESPAG